MNWLAFSLLAVGLWGLWGFLSKVAALQLPAGAVYLMSITGHLAVIGFLAAPAAWPSPGSPPAWPRAWAPDSAWPSACSIF